MCGAASSHRLCCSSPRRPELRSRSRKRVKRTAEPVWTLAMDGSRVAYASAGRIYVWNVATGATSVVKGSYSNVTHSANASEIAIAGKRVAWINAISSSATRKMASTSTPRRLGGTAHQVEHVYSATPWTIRRCAEGGWHRQGSGRAPGSMLAVSTWKSERHDRHRRVTRASSPRHGLSALAGDRAGPNTIVSAAADAGHIAVVLARTLTDPDTCTWAPSTSVNIYSTAGELLRQVALGAASEVALSGKQLVGADAGAPRRTLQVYDWTTGTL